MSGFYTQQVVDWIARSADPLVKRGLDVFTGKAAGNELMPGVWAGNEACGQVDLYERLSVAAALGLRCSFSPALCDNQPGAVSEKKETGLAVRVEESRLCGMHCGDIGILSRMGDKTISLQRHDGGWLCAPITRWRDFALFLVSGWRSAGSACDLQESKAKSCPATTFYCVRYLLAAGAPESVIRRAVYFLEDELSKTAVLDPTYAFGCRAGLSEWLRTIHECRSCRYGHVIQS
jgi:hypothetical protein